MHSVPCTGQSRYQGFGALCHHVLMWEWVLSSDKHENRKQVQTVCGKNDLGLSEIQPNVAGLCVSSRRRVCSWSFVSEGVQGCKSLGNTDMDTHWRFSVWFGLGQIWVIFPPSFKTHIEEIYISITCVCVFACVYVCTHWHFCVFQRMNSWFILFHSGQSVLEWSSIKE